MALALNRGILIAMTAGPSNIGETPLAVTEVIEGEPPSRRENQAQTNGS